MTRRPPALVPTRRDFLIGAAGVALIGSAPSIIGRASAGAVSWKQGDPFSLGVAAGDPTPDGFVLWTRLAPEPLSPNPDIPGGASGPDIPVAYEIAADVSFRDIVRKGEALAEAQYAYSVHLEVRGLEPRKQYWYRFSSGDAQSRVGRALTAPQVGAPLDRLRFGFCSCSNFETGYFSAYRHLADEQPDLVIFLGDYFYEYVSSKPGVRKHSDGVECTDLRTYRNRLAQYRTDPDLQRLHADAVTLMTWDDHEVVNDYSNQWPPDGSDPEAFLLRRAAAYRAYYEHMPLRPSLSKPDGANMRIYDRYTYGDLVQFNVLDGRQYRPRAACYDTPRKGRGRVATNADCPERLNSERTLLGKVQEAWLLDGLAKSSARWNVLAQDVCMSQLRQKRDDGSFGYWSDDWNGHPAGRARVLQHMHDTKAQNPVVITGDMHAFWANDLLLNFDDPSSPTVATEFVGTSITSGGPPYELFAKELPHNPHVRFFDNRVRGYASVEITPSLWTTRMQQISDVKDPNATVSTLKTFVVESGKPGAVEG